MTRRTGFGDDQARDLIIRTIIGEAGGEQDPMAWIAVAHVIRNRADHESHRYGRGLGQILRGSQFSANRGGPMPVDRASPLYERVGAVVDGVFNDAIPDPTQGATHFYNPKTSSPAWGPGMQGTRDIGGHRFGKADIEPAEITSEHGVDPKTQNAIDWIRRQAAAEGITLRVTSGYRTPEKNREVGGAADSQHLERKAFDLGFAAHSPAQRARLAVIASQAPGVNGLVWEGDHLHVDTRAGRRAVIGFENAPEEARVAVAAFRQGYPQEPLTPVAAAPAAAPGGPQSTTPPGVVQTAATSAPAGGAVDPTLATSIAAATPAGGPVTTTADIPASGGSTASIELPPPPTRVDPAAIEAKSAAAIGGADGGTTALAGGVTPPPATGEAAIAEQALALPEVKPFRPLNIGAAPRPRPAPPASPPPVQGFEGARDVAAPYRPQNQPQGLDKEGSRPLPLAPVDYPDSLTPALPPQTIARPPLAWGPDTSPLPQAMTRPPLPYGPDDPPLPLAPPGGFAESPNNPNTVAGPIPPPAAVRQDPVSTGSTGGGIPLPPPRPPEFGGPPVGGPAPGMGAPGSDWDVMMNIARGGTGALAPQPAYAPTQAPPPYLATMQNPFGGLFQRLFG